LIWAIAQWDFQQNIIGLEQEGFRLGPLHMFKIWQGAANMHKSCLTSSFQIWAFMLLSFYVNFYVMYI
jgi:hypothetical protein